MLCKSRRFRHIRPEGMTFFGKQVKRIRPFYNESGHCMTSPRDLQQSRGIFLTESVQLGTNSLFFERVRLPYNHYSGQVDRLLNNFVLRMGKCRKFPYVVQIVSKICQLDRCNDYMDGGLVKKTTKSFLIRRVRRKNTCF